MVSSRCSIKICDKLSERGIVIPEINQGILEFQEELDGFQLLQLKETLLELGFEALNEAESMLLDKITHTIKKLIYEQPEIALEEHPNLVAEKIGSDYSPMMLVFLQVHGVDMLQYAMIQQVERIKEMILYEGRSFNEIIKLFHFINGAQLIRNFQTITGLKPSYYKMIRNKRLEVQRRMTSVNINAETVRIKDTN